MGDPLDHLSPTPLARDAQSLLDLPLMAFIHSLFNFTASLNT